MTATQTARLPSKRLNECIDGGLPSSVTMVNRITAELCLYQDRGKRLILKTKAAARSVGQGAASSWIESASRCAQRLNWLCAGLIRPENLNI
jgi:hypothetical protein